MTIVYQDFDLPGGGTPPSKVEVTLWGNGEPIVGRVTSTGKFIGGTTSLFPSTQGYWELDLVANSLLTPEGTTYRVAQIFGCNEFISFISVPASGGPYDVQSIEVDAMNNIAPPLLSVHASDVTLHGGGIEIDFADLDAGDITVTGAVIEHAVVPGLALEVPDLPRPVYLTAHLVATPTATDEATFGIGPWDGSQTLINTFLLRESRSRYAVTTAQFAEFDLFFRVPPHTPSLWAVYGKRATSPYTVTVRSAILYVPSFRAETK